MSVDKATVEHVAKLAHIRVDGARTQALADELSKILDWVERLSEVDTDGVEPMTSAVEHALHWRRDAVTEGGETDKVLANAPAAEFGFFAVPKVIE